MIEYIYNVIRIREDVVIPCNHPFIEDLMKNYKLYGNEYGVKINPNSFKITGIKNKFSLELIRNGESKCKLLIEGLDTEKVNEINNAILGLESKLWKLEKPEGIV